MDKDLAEETSLLALKVSAALDNHLRKIQEKCSTEDIGQMRSGMGVVKGLLYTDIMEPLWKMHPDLRPQEMDGPYHVPPTVYPGD